jgi:hypothetical protein
MKIPWICKQLIRVDQIESQRQATASSAVVDKAEAKKKLTGRLHRLAEKHGFTYNKVTILNFTGYQSPRLRMYQVHLVPSIP